MKKIATISMMILAAGLASAQVYTAQASGAPAKKPASQTSTGKTTTPAATPAAKPKSPMAKPATTAAAKPVTEKPVGAPGGEIGKGKRDPFLSPVVVRGTGTSGPGCSSGPHCLAIDQVTLQGTVCNHLDMASNARPRACKEWIAVLANPAKKVYYLRMNDAMFDGYIMRIDGNSVVFKQTVLDAMGRQTQREVVKTVAPIA